MSIFSPTATELPTNRDFSGDVVSRVVNTGDTTMVQIFGHNLEAAANFLFIFDLAALPADGATPDISPLPLAAAQPFSLTVPPNLFTTGLVWANSSTDTTLTVSVGLGANSTTWYQ